MRIDVSHGYVSGNHRLWGWVISTGRRQFFIGFKTKLNQRGGGE